jgi:serine protease Do
LGDSGGIESGQTVLALGSPHGLARSVTKGIVSQTARYLGGSGEPVAMYNTWIQTDAAIYPGNSGGPLVDRRGRVIGVNTRKLSGSDSIGFAIPVDTVKMVVDAILAEGRVRRSWIGVDLQEMLSKTDDPAQRGVVVADVNPVGPAAAAGIRPGDVLEAVGGAEVHARYPEELATVRQRIANLPVGQPAEFRVRRDGETATLTIETEELSDVRGQEIAFEDWGFTAMDLTQEIVRRAQLDSDRGVLVTGAQVGSAAGNASLATGDVILRMDGEPVEGVRALRDMIDARAATGQELVLLDVKRGALTRYVVVEQGAAPEPAAPVVPESAVPDAAPEGME